MNCPVCKTHPLTPTELENGLPAYHCETCSGVWLMSNEYLRWVRTHPPQAAPKLESAPSLNLDVPIAKTCPNCGYFMLRYDVLPGHTLIVDRCSNCNGIWFDHQEWEALTERSLHTRINEFFTRPWQDKLKSIETHQKLDALYREKLGEADYRKVQEIRAWLRDHPRQAMLFAFLQSDDPYKV
jgi:Zn-finger nucleic acid-binding protein